MNKNNFKNTAVLLQDNLDDDIISIYFQQQSLDLDIFERKIFKPTISKTKRKATTNISKIYFLNKGVNLLMYPIFFMIHQRKHTHLLISDLIILLLYTHLQIQSCKSI